MKDNSCIHTNGDFMTFLSLTQTFTSAIFVWHVPKLRGEGGGGKATTYEVGREERNPNFHSY